MMKWIASVMIACCLLGGIAQAQEKKDAKPSSDLAKLELRAAEAFNKGEFTTAIPLLQKLADAYQDKPEKLGPIQENIRVAQQNLLAARALQPQPNPQDEIKTSPEERKPHKKPKAGEVYEAKIMELGNFNYDSEKGGNIPADVKALSGSKIKTKGFMIPLDQADNITEFALVPDLFACCFGQPPQVQHTMLVRAPKGKAVSYFADEIWVEGTLTVQEKKEDGIIISIFEMDTTSVKPVGGK